MHVLLQNLVILALPNPDISLLDRSSARELVHRRAVLRQKPRRGLLHLEHLAATAPRRNHGKVRRCL